MRALTSCEARVLVALFAIIILGYLIFNGHDGALTLLFGAIVSYYFTKKIEN